MKTQNETPNKQAELPKEFEDMVNTLLFPKKFWSIFEKLMMEAELKGIREGKARAISEFKDKLNKKIDDFETNLDKKCAFESMENAEPFLHIIAQQFRNEIDKTAQEI